MHPSITVEPARVEEWAPALRLVFQYLPPGEQDSRLATALALVNCGDLDPAGILVARCAGRLVGAMVCQAIAGASGLLWPPQTVTEDRQREWEDLLIQRAVAWLRRCGAKLGQALMPPREAPLATSLERNGFTHITRLWYLRRAVRASDRLLPHPEYLTYESYASGDREQFHQTLLLTYEGTLDCPEVNGVRDLNEIITGHQAQGRHDPVCWWLARKQGQPVGVLLLAEMPEGSVWDVSYVGVVPGARGRGLGRQLMAKALAEAEAAGMTLVTLSVDERNHPARQLYYALGFVSYDQREVFLAIWNKR